jgi:very-long-chain enoyl-CoA reductase
MGVTALQVLGLAGCIGELQGNNAGYSKFAHENVRKVPSRTGMVLLYFPALLVSVSYLQAAPSENGRAQLTAGLLVFHFGKRVAECIWLHIYSGTMDMDFMMPISTSYALTAALTAHQQLTVPVFFFQTQSSRDLAQVGLALSLIGQLGNFYHHWLLRQLRSEGPKQYCIPSGGLFGLVTMPHYFFELLSWLGLACVTQHLSSFLVFASMLSYLSGRSVATTQWYKSKFKDYPSDRRHLIPFLF